VTPALVEAFARLVPQLAPAAPIPSAADLQQMIDSPATTLLVALAGGEIVGSTTLVLFRIPGGLRARIESVVVDQAARGRGIGEALCREAIARARAAGAALVDLESLPARLAANRLYPRLGFERRDTNVYRLRLSDPSGRAG
jgi:ribosomal protein S18 acetylase RimI-like enzyme